MRRHLLELSAALALTAGAAPTGLFRARSVRSGNTPIVPEAPPLPGRNSAAALSAAEAKRQRKAAAKEAQRTLKNAK